MAQIRQSLPDYGTCFLVKISEIFQVSPLRSEAALTYGAIEHHFSREVREVTYWTRSRVYFDAFRRRRLPILVFRPNEMDQAVSSIWSTSKGWWPAEI